MVIFFQGCQFNCSYCHNHHTIGICNNCGKCIDSCPSSSLKLVNGKLNLQSSTCINCDTCIKVCPQNSSPFYKQYSVDEIINKILEIKDFISGITLSGGEVMLQYMFVHELFSQIKQNKYLKHLSLFIDSNGDCEIDAWKDVLAFTDGFMIDIKAAKTSSHKKITGKTNSRVLKSISFLNSIGKLYEVRTVIVSQINDSNSDIEALKYIYSSLDNNVRKVIIKLRKHGVREKHNSIVAVSDNKMKEIADNLGSDIIII